jgi:hypothetical protein
MSVPPPRAAVLESERPEPPATALPQDPSPPARTSALRRPGVERIVLGLLLAAAGAAWLLDEIGVSVPWALAPAAGVVLIGIALILTARSPGGHAPLVVWGGILLAVALVVAVARPVGGPVGDRVLTPTASQWPVATSMAAGNLTIDLRQNPLPPSGRLAAHLNVGNVVLRLPAENPGRPVKVIAHVGIGQIRVDGRNIRDGLGLDWSSASRSAVVVDVQVGTGNLEVDHG